MDKCQTNALTPLLELAQKRKLLSVVVEKREPQLHEMYALQSAQKDLWEDTYVYIKYAVSQYDIKGNVDSDAVKCNHNENVDR